MNGAILAIDAGNTRIKWGFHDGAGWGKRATLPTASAAEVKAQLAGLPALRTVIVSNVAGGALQRQLGNALPVLPPPRWIKSERSQCGVLNDYADPAQLGCDRWAALIGARHMMDGSLLVVSAGTAVTVDALTSEGVFVGGIIAAGAELMYRSLAANTAALKAQPGKFDTFPTNTRDAIASGAIDALCGAIERMARFVEDSGQASPKCLLSGGGAALLAPHLNLEAKVVDNLVLEGLLIIAREG